MEKILLFIPGYNCEKQIVRVLKKIDDSVMKYVDEIIFVNNRSKDNTEKEVLNFKSKNSNINLKVLRNNDNYGLGGSHKVAFSYAMENNFDYVIVLHGDDQGNINDLMPLLQSGEYKKYDATLGARFMKGSKLIGYSKFRTVGNGIYNFIFSSLLGKRIYDLGSGLNMYKVETLKNKFYINFADNLTFNCYMLLAAKQYKHKMHFFPLTWREEDQQSNVKMFRQSINTLNLVISYFFLRQKFLNGNFRDENKNYSFKIIEDDAK